MSKPTLEDIEKLVPVGLPPDIREDVKQEVAVILLQGKTLDLKRIINKVYRQSPRAFGHPRDLDVPSLITGKTLEETHPLSPVVCNIAEKHRQKVYSGKWYVDAGHVEGDWGRPRAWFYTKKLTVFRTYHSMETCKMGEGWCEKRFTSLHAKCPHCGHLMHLKGRFVSKRFGEVWQWICRVCDAHVCYQGKKTWADRLPSPVVNGRRIHCKKHCLQ